MVQRQSMSCARSPVVAGQKKPDIAERGHHVQLVLSHRAEGIIDVVRTALRGTDTIAVAPQVRHDHVVPSNQGIVALMPAVYRLLITMEQQYSLPRAHFPQA